MLILKELYMLSILILMEQYVLYKHVAYTYSGLTFVFV